MSMIQLSLQHNTTLEDAKASLASAVADVQQRFGTLIQQTTWSDDRTAVTLSGPGVVVDLKLDVTHIHATGDIPMLGKLLGSGIGQRLSQGLRGALQKHFPRGITETRGGDGASGRGGDPRHHGEK